MEPSDQAGNRSPQINENPQFADNDSGGDWDYLASEGFNETNSEQAIQTNFDLQVANVPVAPRNNILKDLDHLDQQINFSRFELTGSNNISYNDGIFAPAPDLHEHMNNQYFTFNDEEIYLANSLETSQWPSNCASDGLLSSNMDNLADFITLNPPPLSLNLSPNQCNESNSLFEEENFQSPLWFGYDNRHRAREYDQNMRDISSVCHLDFSSMFDSGQTTNSPEHEQDRNFTDHQKQQLSVPTSHEHCNCFQRSEVATDNVSPQQSVSVQRPNQPNVDDHSMNKKNIDECEQQPNEMISNSLPNLLEFASPQFDHFDESLLQKKRSKTNARSNAFSTNQVAQNLVPLPLNPNNRQEISQERMIRLPMSGEKFDASPQILHEWTMHRSPVGASPSCREDLTTDTDQTDSPSNSERDNHETLSRCASECGLKLSSDQLRTEKYFGHSTTDVCSCCTASNESLGSPVSLTANTMSNFSDARVIASKKHGASKKRCKTSQSNTLTPTKKQILMEWYHANSDSDGRAYLSEEAKSHLAVDCEITPKQVATWVNNQRNRNSKKHRFSSKRNMDSK